MSTAPSTLNPSHTVERIREIIVGRQLDRLEQRISRLESPAPAMASLSGFDDRMGAAEAKLEALREGLQRHADATREEFQQRAQQQRADAQRLAAQIQQVAAMKGTQDLDEAASRMESRIGAWLGNWQTALQNHLTQREQQLAGQLRGEFATLWENMETQLTRLQSRAMDRDLLEQRFARVAAAARALAEAAAPYGHEDLPPR
jgi:HPt (histidine-containing phosphotransfer) domain-containing protein